MFNPEVAENFKLHEKSHVRLNYVFNQYARKKQETAKIPMYFEFQQEPTESYHLPNEYYPTDDSLRFAFAEHYGFSFDLVTLDKDAYGDTLIKLQGRPYAVAWWDFND